VPLSKKRVKKKEQRKSAGPPPPKSVVQSKKKSLTRQQIAIYVISALIIISMAVGFIVSGMGGGQPTSVPPSDASQELILPTPEDGETGSQGQNGESAPIEDEAAGSTSE
jgi:hypothetical protein